ncbi:MAG: hypothetical protein UU93_C0029G0004 [Candidatus Amesbacteria bacterium GW2011_GWA2_42_12]|uniref:Glycosyltransferase 2-like domain-containing protein n=1 Tax=Candidatus Amesbacteria bacterium GW2011_GWA2_42_12 TaxID=1618356 RepID=A0A0G0Y2I8_9BACT|nr:MAG: hypothetical protein UU93_C0029G0004 [Candidatus Amesbacteria bacterium GW2011_GWA2_42_12]
MQKSIIKLSIIIVEYKSGKYGKMLVQSLPKRKDWEVIVVDNSFYNRGFSSGCNEGAKKAKGKYLLFLNPDVMISEPAIETLLKYLETHPKVGVVGPRYKNAEGNTEQCSTDHPTPLVAAVALSFLNTLFPNIPISKKYWLKGWNRESTRKVGVISGAAMMVRTKEFFNLGMFDEQYFLYWEEFDFCKRYQQIGLQSVYVAEAVADHPREISVKQSTQNLLPIFLQSRRRYFRKFYGLFPMIMLEFWLGLWERWRVVILALWSLFLRVVDLQHLNLIGDQGRDYLQALNLLHGKAFPLLGIPSSIPRFSQGPLNIWFAATSFLFGGANPYSPVLFAAVLTTLGVLLLYWFVEKHYGKTVAFSVSMIAAVAPGAVLQSRMPFYLFAVPLFLIIFFYKIISIQKTKPTSIFWATLSYWLLFQWELAVIPLFLVLPLSFLYKKIKIKTWIFPTVFGTIIGILPQLVYDISHSCSHLCGLGFWVGYRIVAITGFDGRHGIALPDVPTIFSKIGLQFEKLFDLYSIGTIAIFILIIFSCIYQIALWKQKQHDEVFTYVVFASIFLLFGIFIHGSPSEAYMPPFLVLIPLLLAKLLSVTPIKLQKLFTILCLLYAAGISYSLISNHFFAREILPQMNASRWIARDARDGGIDLKSYDTPSRMPTYLDTYRFLLSIFGAKLDPRGTRYVISQEESIVLPSIDVMQQTFGYVRVVKEI